MTNIRWFNVRRLSAPAEVYPLGEYRHDYWSCPGQLGCSAMDEGFAPVVWDGEMWTIHAPVQADRWLLEDLSAQVSSWQDFDDSAAPEVKT